MIVISEFMNPQSVAELETAFPVLYNPNLVDQPQELAAAVRTAKALIVRNRTNVDANLLHRADHLTCVGRLGVGLDNIDLALCAKKNITVFPATGANADSVAEYVIATAMILSRPIYQKSASVLAGSWPRNDGIGYEIGGKILGLVGFGSIARVTAHRAIALGMHVKAYDPYLSETDPAWQGVQCVSLDDLVRHSDIISLHLPLSKETANLINRQRLAQMKTSAILINSARGGIVDEIALAEALSSRRLRGAALDVFSQEPATSNSLHHLAGLDNVILTPHIAGVTHEASARVSAVTAHNVAQHLGMPLPTKP